MWNILEAKESLVSLRCWEGNSGQLDREQLDMARDETEVLGKQGHECQVKALNLALRACETTERF